jgi:pimeloyl-ACP methyl ester carboxylesterase
MAGLTPALAQKLLVFEGERRTFLGRGAAGAIAIGLPIGILGGGSSAHASATFKGTHGNGFCNSAFFITHTRQLGKEYGLTLEFVNTPTFAEMVTFFGAGMVDVSVLPCTSFIGLYDKGAPATPDQFAPFADAVRQMQRTEPNYSVRDLADVHVPVAIVQGEHDEFIKLEHAEYLARSIPGAEFILLPGVSHFAPLQRPEKFNCVMQAFLRKLPS